MAVYFAQAETTDLVKIGYATNVQRRRALLQAGCPYPLAIVRVTEGGTQTERWLHRHFAGQLVEREWFRWSDDMLSVAPPSEIEIAPKAFGQLFGQLGGLAAVARHLNLSPGGVQQMKRRNRVGPQYWNSLIEMAGARGIGGITAEALWHMMHPGRPDVFGEAPSKSQEAA